MQPGHTWNDNRCRCSPWMRVAGHSAAACPRRKRTVQGTLVLQNWQATRRRQASPQASLAAFPQPPPRTIRKYAFIHVGARKLSLSSTLKPLARPCLLGHALFWAPQSQAGANHDLGQKRWPSAWDTTVIAASTGAVKLPLERSQSNLARPCITTSLNLPTSGSHLSQKKAATLSFATFWKLSCMAVQHPAKHANAAWGQLDCTQRYTWIASASTLHGGNTPCALSHGCLGRAWSG